MGNIPRIIHYCWFGNNDKSDLLKKCISSWKKFYPDYEIIEWNESNFDVNQHPYCKEAYEHEKWAFVSDYARLVVVYQYGGIYFDTDVEVLRRFDDLLEEYGYLCFEHTSNIPSENNVNTGLGFAALAGSTVIEAMIREYENVQFINNGVMDLITCPERNTNALLKLGLRRDGSMQLLGDIMIYPYEYFCGIDIANSHNTITSNTRTIHHYSSSWKKNSSTKEIIKYKFIVPLLQKLIGCKNYDRMNQIREMWRRRSSL